MLSDIEVKAWAILPPTGLWQVYILYVCMYCTYSARMDPRVSVYTQCNFKHIQEVDDESWWISETFL